MDQSSEIPKISCIIRSRPLNTTERNKNEENVLEFQSDQTVLVKEYK